jgi:hypothetical protein
MGVFGVLGLVWATQIASLLRVGCFAHDDALAFVVLPVVVPAAMSVLGLVLATPSAGRLWVAAFVVPMTGLIVGLVTGVLWWPSSAGMSLAVAHGLAFGAVAFVLLAPVIVALSHRARPRSLMDTVDRYTTWSYAAGAACVSSVLTLPMWTPFPACVADPSQAQAASLVSAIASLLALVLLVSHVRRSRRILALCPEMVDIGLQDDAIDRAAPTTTVYRHVPVSPVVLYAAQAHAMMKRRVIMATVCTAVALGCATVGVTATMQ